jgi:transcriptional regulator with XRE-family HTH domain
MTMQADVFDTVAFGHRLRQARKKAGLSQAELAAQIGVHQPWISEMEHGGQGPVSATTLIHLARALGVSTDDLLGVHGEQAHPRADTRRAARAPRTAKTEEYTNTAALALLAQWYATPEDTPPAYWDELEAAIEAHPIQFGDEDTDN